MPSVIDSLVVELGLDPAKFKEGMKLSEESAKRGVDAAQKAGRNIEHEGAKIGDVFSKLKREALGFTAAFLGGKGIKDFVQHITTLDAATGRMAYTMNMSARELNVWEGAGQQLGAQAGSITGALQGLSSAMNTFALTGQGGFLPVVTHLGLSLNDANGRMKTSAEMFLEIADAVHKLNISDPARAAATLAMIPGANQDSIQLMIRGRAAMEGLLRTSRESGGTTEDSAKAAAEYQKQLSLLTRTAESLGRTIVTLTAPALTMMFQKLKALLDLATNAGSSKEEQASKLKWGAISGGVAAGALGGLVTGGPVGMVIGAAVGGGVGWAAGTSAANDLGVKKVMSPEEMAAMRRKQEESSTSPDTGGGPGRGTLAEQEAYIRRAATARGIDPNVAVKVWESEGKHGVGPALQSNVIRRDGSREESYGPYQLFMGKGGLGQKALSQGLDPRDPSTWSKQVDFSLDEAAKGGWGPWHGWKGHPRAGLPAPGGAPGAAMNSNSGRQSANQPGGQTINIAELNINTKATDADGIAQEIPEALRRANFAASANYGLT